MHFSFHINFVLLKLSEQSVPEISSARTGVATIFVRRRITNKHGIIPDYFYVLPTNSYVGLSSQKSEASASPVYYDCRNTAAAGIHLNIAYMTETATVILVYNLLVPEFRYSAIHNSPMQTATDMQHIHSCPALSP